MNNNDKISNWMGMPCTCEHGVENGETTRYWGDCAMHGLGGVSVPWTASERRAVDLLAVFPERGYGVSLESMVAPDGWGLTVFRDGAEWFTYEAPTIAQAICGAVLHIIESRHEG